MLHLKKSLISSCVVALMFGVSACSEKPETATVVEAPKLVKESTGAWSDFIALADFIEDKGDRTAGTQLESQMADWIAEQWEEIGFEVTRLSFDFTLKGEALTSQNLSIDIPGSSDEILLVGAHYDAVGENTGSLGLIDNGSGVAALITLAKKLKSKELPYTVRLVVFGAEERGLIGSKDYVNRDDVQLDKVIAMVNLDTIIGGDMLYVHSAHSTPYNCTAVEEANYVYPSAIREGIRAASISLYPDSPHLLHPTVEGYPEGETGPWSDHSPFACAGIEIAYIEATNFTLNGKNGHDGYSQAADKAYWDCFDAENLTSCDRENEKAWGEIWHTKFDRRSALFPVMKDKLQQQQEQNVEVLAAFLNQPNKWMK